MFIAITTSTSSTTYFISNVMNVLLFLLLVARVWNSKTVPMERVPQIE